jgi:hypothetical protein
VPVLEKEYRNASRRLEETQSELSDMHPEKLKVRVALLRAGGLWARTPAHLDHHYWTEAFHFFW